MSGLFQTAQYFFHVGKYVFDHRWFLIPVANYGILTESVVTMVNRRGNRVMVQWCCQIVSTSTMRLYDVNIHVPWYLLQRTLKNTMGCDHGFNQNVVPPCAIVSFNRLH